MTGAGNQSWWSYSILFSPSPFCLSVFPLSLIGPQDQYQYLYKALLSLVGPKESTSSLLARNINGTMASMSDQSDQAESMESLV